MSEQLQLIKFMKTHFTFTNDELQLLPKLADIIVSEYDLIDIVDSELVKLLIEQ